MSKRLGVVLTAIVASVAVAVYAIGAACAHPGSATQVAAITAALIPAVFGGAAAYLSSEGRRPSGTPAVRPPKQS